MVGTISRLNKFKKGVCWESWKNPGFLEGGMKGQVTFKEMSANWRQFAGHGHCCTSGREYLWFGLKNGQAGLKLWVPVRTKQDKVSHLSSVYAIFKYFNKLILFYLDFSLVSLFIMKSQVWIL